MTLKEELLSIMDKHPHNITNVLTAKKYNYHDVVNSIMNYTNFLPSTSTLLTRLYYCINEITEPVKCLTCGQPLTDKNVINLNKGLVQYCSSKCSINSPITKNKIAETNIKKYGCSCCFASSEIKQKIIETNRQKYGVDYPQQNKDIQKQTQQTVLQKYGVNYYSQSEECKNKVKQTCNEKYGVDSISQVEDFKQKAKLTMLNKYGVEHNSQSVELREAMVKSMIKKYGENYKQVIWGNHGNTGANKRAYKYILMSPEVEPMFTETEYIEGKLADINTKFKFKCKSCGTEFMSIWDNGACNSACPFCHKHSSTSKSEKELLEFIQSLRDYKLIENDKNLIKPYEIDIVDNNMKLCFEYDGLYWHCDEIHKDHNYHLNKMTMCNKKGYNLIHVFENEWLHKREIVKSRIKNLYGMHDKRIFARKCIIKEIPFDKADSFLSTNHLQGSCMSSINIGLYFNDELVSVMTFGKSRFNKNYQYELLRFCSKLHYSVIGGASKLLKYFERTYKPISLLSYADRRWSNGNIYQKLGFNLSNVSRPNYWYIQFTNSTLISRVNCQKHKLKKMLDNFNPNISESENMKENGYGRIFDCGNFVFTKHYLQV